MLFNSDDYCCRTKRATVWRLFGSKFSAEITSPSRVPVLLKSSSIFVSLYSNWDVLEVINFDFDGSMKHVLWAARRRVGRLATFLTEPARISSDFNTAPTHSKLKKPRFVFVVNNFLALDTTCFFYYRKYVRTTTSAYWRNSGGKIIDFSSCSDYALLCHVPHIDRATWWVTQIK